jgi:alkanesulfonate monooxygenase
MTVEDNTAPPRFGVWAQTQGAWGSLQHPGDPVDASWERNKRQIVEAEALGFDSTLVAQHTINPNGPAFGQLEAWTSSAALAALTSRIEIITAIKPYLFHPVVLAKMALQIEEISGGRFGINLVNAWFKPELDKAGIGFAEHDARYAYGSEWLAVVSGLLEGRELHFEGEHFRIDGYQLTPAATHRARPRIYLGGESEPARVLAASQADVYFINGQPFADVQAVIADLSRRDRHGKAPLRFGLSAFVVARPTAAQARDELAYLFSLAEKDAPARQQLRANADPKAVMFQTSAKSPRFGTNGGTAAGLVGSYDEVAERIRHFHAAGVETFMLQFQPFEAEMRRFAQEVIPRVRAAAPAPLHTP